MDVSGIIYRLSSSFIENTEELKLIINELSDENFMYKGLTNKELIVALDYHLYNFYNEGRYIEESKMFFEIYLKNTDNEYMLFNVFNNKQKPSFEFSNILYQKDLLTLERKLIYSLKFEKREQEFLKHYKYLNSDLQYEISKMKYLVKLISNESLLSKLKDYPESYYDLAYAKGINFIKYVSKNSSDKLKMKLLKMNFVYTFKVELYNRLSEDNKLKLLVDKSSFIYDDYYNQFETSPYVSLGYLDFPKEKLKEYLSNTNWDLDQQFISLLEILARERDDFDFLIDLIQTSINYTVSFSPLYFKRVNDLKKDDLKQFEINEELNIYDEIFILNFSKMEDKTKIDYLKTKYGKKKIFSNDFDEVFEYYKYEYKQRLSNYDFSKEIINATSSAFKVGIDLKEIKEEIDYIIKYMLNEEYDINKYSLNLLLEIFTLNEASKESLNVEVNVLDKEHYSLYSKGLVKEYSCGFYSDITGYSKPMIVINDSEIKESLIKSVDVLSTIFHELRHAYQYQIELRNIVSYSNLKMIKEDNSNAKTTQISHKKLNYESSVTEYDANKIGLYKYINFLKYSNEEVYNVKKKDVDSEIINCENNYYPHFIIDRNVSYDINYIFDLKNNEKEISGLIKSFPSVSLEYKEDGSKKTTTELLEEINQGSEYEDDIINVLKDRVYVYEPNFKEGITEFNILNKVKSIKDCLNFEKNDYSIEKITIEAVKRLKQIIRKYDVTINMSDEEKIIFDEIINELNLYTSRKVMVKKYE